MRGGAGLLCYTLGMNDIDNYLNKNATETQRAVLQKLRKLVLSLVPDATETISYGVPTIKYKDKYVIYFAAYKNHMSIYPIISDSIRKQLADYDISKSKMKGTVQFTEAKPIPDAVIKDFVKQRLEQIDQGA